MSFLDWTPEQEQRFRDTIDVVGTVENISHAQAVWILTGARPEPSADNIDAELQMLQANEAAAVQRLRGAL